MLNAAVPEMLAHRPWLLHLLLAGSLAANAALVLRGPGSTPVAPPPETAPDPDPTSNAPVPADEVPPLPAPAGAVAEQGTERFAASVERSLSATFQGATASSPAALSAVYARLFAWDLDLRRDLHRGDRVEVLYEEPRGAEPIVLAAVLRVQPESADARLLGAYRWQAPGDRFSSYWSDDGTEVPMRLVDGPLHDYEQITSLLKDRPTHEGMDFKTPIGTPVVSPRAGVVTRTNWNHAANGNCVEVRFGDGTTAKFLHLNENSVQEGQRVMAGMELGKTGNTGRSTGAHLHYQLERGGRVVDPVAYHGTLRRRLPDAALPSFQRARDDLRVQLQGPLASR